MARQLGARAARPHRAHPRRSLPDARSCRVPRGQTGGPPAPPGLLRAYDNSQPYGLAVVQWARRMARLGRRRDNEEIGDGTDGPMSVCGDGERQDRAHRSLRDVAQWYAHAGPTMAVGAEGQAGAVEGHDVVDDGDTGLCRDRTPAGSPPRMDHGATRLGADGHGLEDSIDPSALATRERAEDNGEGAAAGKGTGRHARLRHKSGSHGQGGQVAARRPDETPSAGVAASMAGMRFDRARMRLGGWRGRCGWSADRGD